MWSGSLWSGLIEIETAADGLVFILVDGTRRYRADVGRDDRLIFTGILDPEGPL